MDKSSNLPILPEGLGIPPVKTSPIPFTVSNAWKIPVTSPNSADASFFSNSSSVLSHERLIDSASGTPSIDDGTPDLKHLRDDMELNEPAEDCILPDEEDLIAVLIDDLDMQGTAELEECDVFGIGGMDMDSDPTDSNTTGFARATLSDGLKMKGTIDQFGGVSKTVSWEHPFGERPSRTLFVRNINSNVDDTLIRNMFEQYGEIRSIHTAKKHKGFVMISYYDIRAARTAMCALQNKPLLRKSLDIHFSIPKENPSEKDLNQGTLVIFNLEPSVSHEEILQIFGAYGEVKEIRETPHKRHQKFVEFYDVRAADRALRGLSKSEIAGKRIKLELSRPGGARCRSLPLHPSPDLKDESRLYRHYIGSPIFNSSPGPWEFSPIESNPIQGTGNSPNVGRVISPIGRKRLPGLSSLPTPFMPSNSVKIAPIGKYSNPIPMSSDHFFSHSFPTNDSSAAMNSSLGLTGPEFYWGSPKSCSEHSSSSWQSTPQARPSFLPNNTDHIVQGGQGILYGNQRNHHVGSAPPGIEFETHFGFFS